MDNLTHSLVGATLAKCGLDRRTPLATATLVLAANAPDVDILSYARGPYYGLAFRRGITHGLPAVAVLPFAVTGAVLTWDRWWRRRLRPDAEPARALPVLWLSILGVLTHPILDWMNVYGMRWWVPFDSRWVYGDSLFIIDPWIWLLLGGAVFLSRGWSVGAGMVWGLAALGSSALVTRAPIPAPAKAVWLAGTLVFLTLAVARWPRHDSRRRLAARALGGLAVCYIIFMVGSHRLARREVLEAAETAGIERPDQVMVSPRPGDPLGSDVVVRSGDGYRRGSHRWDRTPRAEVTAGPLIPLRAGSPDVSPGELSAAIAAALTQPDARNYLSWSRFPYYRVSTVEGGWRVTISDARYGSRGAGGLGGVEIDVPGPALGKAGSE